MGPLSKNEYPIVDTKKIPNMLALILHLQDDEEDVPNDGESLFTHIPIEETINYLIKQFYIQKRLTPICSKLIFRKLSVISCMYYRMYF